MMLELRRLSRGIRDIDNKQWSLRERWLLLDIGKTAMIQERRRITEEKKCKTKTQHKP
jgi:hypothetical protein